jgi:hypothetical protein
VTVSVSSFDGNGADGGANDKPFGGAGDAAPGATAFGDAHGVIALLCERGGFLALVGEVVLRGEEFGLAGFAVEREVVERFEVGARDKGAIYGVRTVCKCAAWRARRLIAGMCGGRPKGRPYGR